MDVADLDLVFWERFATLWHQTFVVKDGRVNDIYVEVDSPKYEKEIFYDDEDDEDIDEFKSLIGMLNK